MVTHDINTSDIQKNEYFSEWCLRQILLNEGIEDKEILANTPRRWVQALRGMLGSGAEEFEVTTFESEAGDMVIVQDIQFASLCEHHLLPFYGHAHVAYLPQGRIVGLSKIPRVVRSTSFGLWTQEELGDEIAHSLERGLTWISRVPEEIHKPLGVAVILEAEHTCMTVRGVKAPGAKTKTSTMTGVFLEPGNNARTEFLSLIGRVF